MIIDLLRSDPGSYLMWVALAMFAICFHEFAHAGTAWWQGDSTARDAGHLTLNPLRQMGFFSIAMLLIVGLAWGAVPVRPELMRRRYSHALVSAAGPLANAALFLVFGLFMALAARFGDLALGHEPQRVLVTMFGIGAILNLLLAALNALPLPMLDGWTVTGYLFPRLHRLPAEAQTVLSVVLIVLLLGGGFGFLLFLVKPAIEAYFTLLGAPQGLALLRIFGGT